MQAKKRLLQCIFGLLALSVGLWSFYPMLSVTFWSSSTGFVGMEGHWEDYLKIPSNVFPSLGTWIGQESKDPTEVAFFYDDKHVHYQENVPNDSKKDPCEAKSSSEQCFIWLKRNESTADSTATPFEGNLVVFPSAYGLRSTEYQYWKLLVHQGTKLGAQKAKIVFRGAWDKLSATEAKWMAIGYSQTDAKIQRFFLSNGAYYESLAEKYQKGELSSVEAVKLFHKVYDIEQKNRKESNGSKGKDQITGRELTFEKMVDVSCVWLGEVIFSNASDTTGQMWSTCGDAISWSSSVKGFRAWTDLTKWYAICLLLFQVIPMMWGFWYQLMWIRHSRTHTLRVSPQQVLLLLFWVSFYSRGLQEISEYMPLSGKLMKLIGVFFLMNQFLLWTLFSKTYQEQMNYIQANHSGLNNDIFQALLIIQSGLLSWDLLSEYIVNSWFLGIFLAHFWLPQVVHFFTFNGWAGLTTPFSLGSTLLVLVPVVLVLVKPPRPWVLPKESWSSLLISTLVLSLQLTMLTALRWKTNGYLLPHWIAPWRHRYKSSVDVQSAALQENPLCAICRNNLHEGWDESDELWRTPCNHFFHKSCLQRWMEESHDCPLCRRYLPDP